ncbi:hypothetical protein VNI00_015949 [Paramarasmius palmivorus]|uniref:Uncharacterized protein n=1 Tax=Paramarasmius palmivorus TaxID=297713 RepID=A0AAW0BJJ0_9AGAR
MPATTATKFDIFTFDAIVDSVEASLSQPRASKWFSNPFFQLSKRDEIDDIVDMYGDFEDDVQSESSSESSGFEFEDVEEMETMLDAFVATNKTSEVYKSFFRHVDQLVEFEDFNPQVSFKTASSTPSTLVVPASPKKKTSKSPFPVPNMPLPPIPQTKSQAQKENIKLQFSTSKRERRITPSSLLGVMLSTGRR